MGYRSTNYGRGQALHGDRTTTGAICCSTLPNCTEHGRGVIRVGDKTTACPKCGKQGVVADGEQQPDALHRSQRRCVTTKGDYAFPGADRPRGTRSTAER